VVWETTDIAKCKIIIPRISFHILEKESIEVLFIGECGSGKSTTINSLLGGDKCSTGKTFRLNGLTGEVQQYPVTLLMRNDAPTGKSYV
jgi:ribosome biogenesis GTPase A